MSSKAGNGVIEHDTNPGKTSFDERFLRFAENDTYSDCEFVIGAEKTIIKGHKLIFSAASEVFEAMFYGLIKEDKSVIVDDLSLEGFKGMKTFIYAGKIDFTSAIHALLTYIAARKYMVPHLDNLCTKYIEENLRPSEVLEFCDICSHNIVTEFKGLCSKMIQEKTDEVVDSEYLVLAESNTIESILKSSSLKLGSEIEVFDLFERWALAEVERKKIETNEIASSFNHLKKHIRFLTISGDEFVSRVAESALLTQEEKHAIALNQIKLLSKPMPDSISLIQQPRHRSPPSEYLQSSRRFSIPIDKDNCCNSVHQMNFKSTNHTSEFTMHWDYRMSSVADKAATEQDPNPGEICFEERFSRFAKSDIYSDCEFIVGREKTIIKGHKLIFCAASEVFEAMFFGPLKEDNSVRIDDLSADGFEGMKTFIYVGKVDFTSLNHALLIFIAARKYLIPKLKNVCNKFIRDNLNSHNVLQFCDTCSQNNVTEFEDLCSFIMQIKTNVVVNSKYFLMAGSDTIELILKSPSLQLRSEIEVFDIFEQWALAEVERKKIETNEIASSFNHLKKHIRFLTVDRDDFVSRIWKSALLTNEEKEAIALNRIEFMSKPMPDSISLIQLPRNFNLPSPKTVTTRFTNRIPIHALLHPNGAIVNQIKLINVPSGVKCPLTLDCYSRHGLMIFRVNTCYSNLKAVFRIKYKLKFLAENRCDDLVIENECKDFADNSITNIVEQRPIYLAMISILELQNKRFLKIHNSQVVIDMEAKFDVQQINLAQTF